jgi:hypothetical protein
MDKENVTYIPTGVLFIHKEERNHGICRKMNDTGDHDANEIKQTSRAFSHVESKGKRCETRTIRKRDGSREQEDERE